MLRLNSCRRSSQDWWLLLPSHSDYPSVSEERRRRRAPLREFAPKLRLTEINLFCRGWFSGRITSNTPPARGACCVWYNPQDGSSYSSGGGRGPKGGTYEN